MVAFPTSQSSVLLLLLLCATTFNGSTCSNIHKVVRCNEKDRAALLMFKHGVINDPGNHLSKWSTQKDCCAWEGVLCDNKTGRVTKLHLRDLDLTGEINSSLFELEFLVHLDLSFNEFEAISIPPIRGNVTLATGPLQYLDLSWNQLQGSIPDSLGQSKKLEYLDLSYNQLKGSIPDSLGHSKKLEYLDLSNNQLKGSIPDSLGQSKKLEHLGLSYNHLNGSVPEWIGQHTENISFLDLSGNMLYGTISETFLSRFPKLKYLYLSNSTFEFHFSPEWIPPFQLVTLDLSNTNLGPCFPPWIYTQKSLHVLDVSSSGITSVDGDAFRSFIGGHFVLLFMSNNSIKEDISNVMLNSSFLKLDHNNFVGRLPYLSQGALHVDFSYNSFSGSIPRHWENSKELEYINLWNNRLLGQIQLDLSNMTGLQVMNLAENEFSGTIPINLPQMLEVMILRSNQFEGHIPPQLFNLSYLFYLDLAHNKLSGSMPRSGYNLNAMIVDNYSQSYLEDNTVDVFTKGHVYEYDLDLQWRLVDFSANNLSGEIPSRFFGLIKVQTLNLSYNQFTGTIPKTIGSMKDLESLDLSNNKLYGKIPQSMVNLSCNNFSGQIPIGTQLQSFNSSSYDGNPELCGAPLRKCGTGDDENPKNAKQHERNEEEDGEIETKSLYLGTGVGFAVGFWGICGSFLLNRKWRHKYYLFLDRVWDQLYITWKVKFNKFLKN